MRLNEECEYSWNNYCENTVLFYTFNKSKSMEKQRFQLSGTMFIIYGNLKLSSAMLYFKVT